MSTTKMVVTAVAIVAVVGTLGTSVLALFEARAAEAALQQAEQTAGADRARWNALAAGEREERREIAELRTKVDAAKTAARLAATTAHGGGGMPTPGSDWDPRREGAAFLRRHPEVKAALTADAVARVNHEWGGLFRELKLSPQQIERFQQVMTRGGGFSRSFGDGRVLEFGGEESGTNINEAVRAIIGDAGMASFRRHGSQREAREYVNSLASTLYFTDTPLSPDQAKQLVETIHEHRTDSGPAGVMRIAWDQVEAAAARFTSAPQRAALDGLRAQERMQEAWVRAQERAGATGER